MGYTHLITRRVGSIEHVSLNRPEVRNAFDDQLIADLTSWAAAIRQDPDVRGVVIGGVGKAFCAGADIAWMARTIHYSEEDNMRDAAAAARMFGALNTLPVPVVGRVQGAAIGGGAGLAAVCDIVVAEDSAMFGFTEVKLGILPAVISPFVIEKIGRSAARELFVSGTRFPAARAKDIGLVHAVVGAADLDRTVDAFVHEILANGKEAMAAAKELIAAVWAQPFERALPMTASALAARRASAEGREGLKAFLEKRKPSWSGS